VCVYVSMRKKISESEMEVRVHGHVTLSRASSNVCVKKRECVSVSM